MATRFLYFDLGNVLLSFSHDRMCRQMAAVADVDEQTVHSVLFGGPAGASLQWRLERGEIDVDAAYEEFCRGAKRRPPREALYAAASDIFAEIPDTISLVRRLAVAGQRMGILSNTNPVDWRHISQRFPHVLRDFQHTVLSFEAGEMKPASGIYECAVRRSGAAPAEVFFTDDRPENVDGALAAGMDAVLFTSADALAEHLCRRGVAGASLS